MTRHVDVTHTSCHAQPSLRTSANSSIILSWVGVRGGGFCVKFTNLTLSSCPTGVGSNISVVNIFHRRCQLSSSPNTLSSMLFASAVLLPCQGAAHDWHRMFFVCDSSIRQLRLLKCHHSRINSLGSQR